MKSTKQLIIVIAGSALITIAIFVYIRFFGPNSGITVERPYQFKTEFDTETIRYLRGLIDYS
ncbi:hypothetical protein KC853_01175 [Candidatus Saccharibacteria bacterium]|nr:hypothetical protein [Candidatus Saccharibacteria bacterium]MCB9834661.1 hypothetical protein [Candidatus Nomurabacteria bacterium]